MSPCYDTAAVEMWHPVGLGRAVKRSLEPATTVRILVQLKRDLKRWAEQKWCVPDVQHSPINNPAYPKVVFLKRHKGPPLKAVIDVHPRWIDEDHVPRRFDFVARTQSLETLNQCINDWVIVREKKQAGSEGDYIGVGRLRALTDQSSGAGMTAAIITDFMPFPTPVSLRMTGRYLETALVSVVQPKQVGATFMRWPVRRLPEGDFAIICQLGFGSLAPALSPSQDLKAPGFGDEADLVAFASRRVEELLIQRQFRDEVFRKNVGQACNYRCAFTGWRLFDHPDHFEVQAAHLWSVADGGPDDPRNGLCLSGTVHWLLDRYFVTISQDFTLLRVSRLIPIELRGCLVAPGRTINLPNNPRLWPHQKFVAIHRTNFQDRRAGEHVV